MSETIFKPGLSYKTRDGREARVYATDGGSGKNLIHGALLINGAWLSQTWRSDGWMVKSHQCSEDLMPPKRELILNVYGDGYCDAFKDIEIANDSVRGTRIARLRVTYTEGQFDD